METEPHRLDDPVYLMDRGEPETQRLISAA